jgi:hypothetical protein
VSLSIKDEPYYVDSFTMQALLALMRLSKQAVPALKVICRVSHQPLA